MKASAALRTESKRRRREAHAVVGLKQIRAQVDEALNRFGEQLLGQVALESSADGGVARLRAQVARLGQLAAGLAIIDEAALPVRGAGFGSLVEVRNLDTQESAAYVLMVGSLVDIDEQQVSLASPIGQALLGRVPGEQITIATPSRDVRLLVTRVRTLAEQLADIVPQAVSS